MLRKGWLKEGPLSFCGVPQCILNGEIELFDGALLREEGGGSGFTHGPFDLRIVVNRQADHGDGRLLMPQLPRRFDSVDARHVDVHDDDFRLEGLGQSNRLFPVSSLPHHLDIRVGVEHAPETLPYHRVIIGQQDADDRILVESCVPAAEC